MEQNGGLRPGQCYRFGWDAASGELAMTIVGTAAAICGQARPLQAAQRCSALGLAQRRPDANRSKRL